MRWLMPSWISPAIRRRSCSCHSTIRSANRSSASSRSASLRCSRAFSIAPATRPATERSSSTSAGVNSRRSRVCTFSTPTR